MSFNDPYVHTHVDSTG